MALLLLFPSSMGTMALKAHFSVSAIIMPMSTRPRSVNLCGALAVGSSIWISTCLCTITMWGNIVWVRWWRYMTLHLRRHWIVFQSESVALPPYITTIMALRSKTVCISPIVLSIFHRGASCSHVPSAVSRDRTRHPFLLKASREFKLNRCFSWFLPLPYLFCCQAIVIRGIGSVRREAGSFPLTTIFLSTAFMWNKSSSLSPSLSNILGTHIIRI